MARQTVILRGFILAETLIAVAIAGIITPPVVAAAMQCAEYMNNFIDDKVIMLRVANVESSLKTAIFYCGYGMPANSKKYKSAFGNQTKEPFNWPGPISVQSYSGRTDAKLRVAYGYPSGVAAYKTIAASGALDYITIQKEFGSGMVLADGNLSKAPSSVKSWILFGCISPLSTPLAVRKLSGRSVQVSSAATSFRIDYGDEAYYFRAGTYYTNADRLYCNDFRTTGDQPKADGIVDMRFKLDKDAGLLKVYILVHGNLKLRSGPKVKGAERWPAEYGVPTGSGPYRYYVEEITWRLQNCLDVSIGNQ